MSTWTRVEPLVAAAELRGRTLDVTFRCPASGRTVRSAAEVRPSTGTKVRAVATRSLSLALRETVLVTVRRLLGWNFLGRFVSHFLAELVPTPSGAITYGDAERQAAVLEAFKAVQAQFGWDEANARYVSLAALRESQSEFERLLAERPVEHAFDRDVLARMLAAVAGADGEIEGAELALFAELGGQRVGTVRETPPPTAGELAETTAACRETLLLLAWTMAWCDGRGEDAEREMLDTLARGLGIGPDRARALASLARAGLLERHIAEAGLDGALDAAERAALRNSAEALGMPLADYDRLEARTRRRLGLQ